MAHRPDDEPTALYRLYDANDGLLYLGISWNPTFRMEQHLIDKHWTHLVVRRTVEWHPDRPTALAAEAAATAVEKPLHDSSWRKSAVGGRPQWLDLEGQQKVVDGLTDEIERGLHRMNRTLVTGEVARHYGVARATASSAMRVLEKRNLLKFLYHGRFSVQKGPIEPFVGKKPWGESGAKQLGQSLQVLTVAELRKVIKDLPEDTSVRVGLEPEVPPSRTSPIRCPQGATCDC